MTTTLLSTTQTARAVGISVRSLGYALRADRYDFPWPTIRNGLPLWYADELSRWRSSAAAAALLRTEDDT